MRRYDDNRWLSQNPDSIIGVYCLVLLSNNKKHILRTPNCIHEHNSFRKKNVPQYIFSCPYTYPLKHNIILMRSALNILLRANSTYINNKKWLHIPHHLITQENTYMKSHSLTLPWHIQMGWDARFHSQEIALLLLES